MLIPDTLRQISGSDPVGRDFSNGPHRSKPPFMQDPLGPGYFTRGGGGGEEGLLVGWGWETGQKLPSLMYYTASYDVRCGIME